MNWILNWMVFYRYSMFEWIIKIYRPGLCPGGSGLVTILDEMFGTEGTMDFLKDNFFEVNLIWHSVMIFVNIISTTIRSKMFELDIFNENAIYMSVFSLSQTPKFQSSGALLFWSLMGLLPWQKWRTSYVDQKFACILCVTHNRSVLRYLWIKHVLPNKSS